MHTHDPTLSELAETLSRASGRSITADSVRQAARHWGVAIRTNRIPAVHVPGLAAIIFQCSPPSTGEGDSA